MIKNNTKYIKNFLKARNPKIKFKKHQPGQPETKTTVGGTLAKTICEVNKFSTKYQAYSYLTTKKLPEQEANVAMLLGTYLETPLLQLVYENQKMFFREDFIKELYTCTGTQFIEDNRSAHIDGFGVDKNGMNFIVEVKNYSGFAHKNYKEIEQAERVQIAHYQSLLRFDYCILIVRVDNNLKVFICDRDKELEKNVKKNIDDFYKEHVIPEKEPFVVSGDIDFLNNKFELNSDFAVLDYEKEKSLNSHLVNYLDYSQKEKLYKASKDSSKAQIINILGDSSIFETQKIEDERYKIKKTLVSRISVDTDKLKIDNLYEKYSKSPEKSVRLTVTKIKK